MSSLWPWLHVVAPFAFLWFVVLAMAVTLDRLVRWLAQPASRSAPGVRVARVLVWSYLLAGAISSTWLNGGNVYDQLLHGWAVGESIVSLWFFFHAMLYPLIILALLVWYANEPMSQLALLLTLLVIPLAVAVAASIWITRPRQKG